MSIRAKFEEIWPVPEGVSWNEACGMYSPSIPGKFNEYYGISCEHDARLDTFTRCQETTDVYVSLVDELVKEIESCYEDLRNERWYVPRNSGLLNRAKQITEKKK